MFSKKSVLKNFGKFTRKQLCQSLFFSKVAYNFIRKETLTQAFSYRFCGIFKKRFFIEHSWKRVLEEICEMIFSLTITPKNYHKNLLLVYFKGYSSKLITLNTAFLESSFNLCFPTAQSFLILFNFLIQVSCKTAVVKKFAKTTGEPSQKIPENISVTWMHMYT